MYKVFVSILATASVALASSPLTITAEARATGAVISLPSSPAASSTSRGSATTTAAAAPLVTRAPSAEHATLHTVTHPHMDPRGRGRYSLDRNTFVSEYDGHVITIKPSILATTLDYHGTHPLTLLTGNRCPDCDRIGDPYDNGDYNGRYDGDHRGVYDPDDDDLYAGHRDEGLRFGPGDHGRHPL